MGAIIGAFGFKYIYESAGLPVTLNMCGMVAIAGLLLTSQFTPETKDMVLDEHIEFNNDPKTVTDNRIPHSDLEE